MANDKKDFTHSMMMDSDDLLGDSYLQYARSIQGGDQQGLTWLRSFIDKMDDGVMLLDPQKYIYMMNNQARHYFQLLGIENVEGMSFTTLGSHVQIQIKERKQHPFGEQIVFDISNVTAPKDHQMDHQIISEDSGMLEVIQMANTIAPTKASVLITGENGTGKELLARLIHDKSGRENQRFIAVNCAALPESLLESELFGHEKGAFTGAGQRKAGKFELADKGTILLDEISEMEISLQSKLLRVIQEKEVDRLGGKQVTNIDIRILATSNVDLREAVRKGKFREDLFYRLNVIHLRIPPLRKRPQDIEALTRYFVQKMSNNYNKMVSDVSPELLDLMLGYHWRGNVRELRNMIERAVLFCKSNVLQKEDFPKELGAGSHDLQGQDQADQINPGMTVRGVERTLILKTLQQTIGNRTHAAKMLGISLRTLRNKINEYRKEGYEVKEYE